MSGSNLNRQEGSAGEESREPEERQEYVGLAAANIVSFPISKWGSWLLTVNNTSGCGLMKRYNKAQWLLRTPGAVVVNY